MKSFTNLLLIICALHPYLSFAKPKVYTEKDCNTPIIVNKKTQIHFESLLPAGYDWYLANKNENIIFDQKYVSKNKKALGGKSNHIFILRSKEARKEKELVFNYKRFWENHVIKTCRFPVVRI